MCAQDDSTDGFDAVVEPYLEAGLVVRHRVRDYCLGDYNATRALTQGHNFIQQPVMTRHAAAVHSARTHWMIFTDVDEFLMAPRAFKHDDGLGSIAWWLDRMLASAAKKSDRAIGGLRLQGTLVADPSDSFRFGGAFSRPLLLTKYPRDMASVKCAVQANRLSRTQYGGIHKLHLVDGYDYSQPCGLQDVAVLMSCAPVHYLHFFFRRSMVERQKLSYAKSEVKAAKVALALAKVTNAQQQRGNARITNNCSKTRNLCELRPLPIGEQVNAAVIKRWARRTVPNDELAKRLLGPNLHRFLHVHGLKHSGTGIVRLAVANAWPQASLLNCSTSCLFESEGQHEQSVWSPLRERTSKICWPPSLFPNQTGTSAAAGRVVGPPRRFSHYFCPGLLHGLTSSKGAQLWADWSARWDLSRELLVQKTPSIDLLLLDRLLPRSHHLVVLRHPFGHRTSKGPLCDTALCRLETWLAAWAYVLRQLHALERYAVVRFESAVLKPTQFKHLLQAWLHQPWPGSVAGGTPVAEGVDHGRHPGRRLMMHEVDASGNATLNTSLVWELPLQGAHDCLYENHEPLKQPSHCALLAERAKSVVASLGYNLLQPRRSNVSRAIVFSPATPAPKDMIYGLVMFSRLLGFGTWEYR